MKNTYIYKKKARIIAFFLVFATSFSIVLASGVSNALPFTDVKATDWFYGAVNYAVENGLVSGTSATTFSPSATMTRGQFVTVLGRMDGVDTGNVSINNKFHDVTRGAYYAPYVYWANANGIISGTSDSAFSPDTSITREQMATIVARYLAYKKVTLPADNYAVPSFADTPKVSSWAKDSVETLRKCGLLSGDNNRNVNPQNNMTRAEGVTVFMRLMEKMKAAGVQVGGSWFRTTSSSYTISLNTKDVGMYDYLTDAARTKAETTGAFLGIYSISDRTILNTKNGYFVPMKEGTVKVTWVYNLNNDEVLYAEANITVNASDVVECLGITATIDKAELASGETAQINVVFNPSNTTNKSLTYVSYDLNIVKVSTTGLVVAVKKGTTSIQVRTENNLVSTVSVTVTTDPKVDEVEIVYPEYDVDDEYISRFNAEFIRLLNIEREKAGLSLVTYYAALQDGATLRASECQEFFSHTRPDGTSFRTAFIGAVDNPQGRMAECAHEYGGKSNEFCDNPEQMAQSAFNGWFASSAHRAVLMTSGENIKVACGITKHTESSFAVSVFELYK